MGHFRLESDQESSNEIIFGALHDVNLKATADTMSALKEQLEKACKEIALEL